MKLFKLLYLLLFFASSFVSSVLAQGTLPVLTKIMTKTAKIYEAEPIEKVYLHFDKPYYTTGDTIWFKAYLTIDQHAPSNISKIINVDVLTSRDTLMQSLKLQVKDGVAWAAIPLPATTYKEGNYRVVAYTNYMNNLDPAYFFSKNIVVGDAINNSVSTQISLKSNNTGKAPKITAGIYYKDYQGNPLAGRKVTWTVDKDYESVIKGKGETDKNGFIDIGFVNSKNINLDSAKLVTVIDKGDRKQVGRTFPLNSVSGPNDFQFFAEGGQLIAGIPSKVAFKVLKPNGLGIDAKGTITDNTGKAVAEFASSHLGMGRFDFTPEDGKTYTTNVTFADGSTAKPELPKIFVNAIALSLDNSNADVLKVKLQADAAFAKDYQGKTFFLLAKSAGIICFAAQTKLEGQFYNASIPKTKFPTGIVQVTLFTDDGEPLSERIAFIQHNDQLNLSIAGDHPSYTVRQKVKLNVTAKNNSQPDEGHFSIAVVDDSKVPYDENAETTILTYLLLTSDVKGYIEKPNYYFNGIDDKKSTDLDILMQTQGYRRFSYDGILTDKYPPINYLPEQGITITGTLRASSGIPINNGNVRILIKDKNYSENAITNAEGRFSFRNLVFTDSTQVNISARNNPRASDLVLTVDGDGYQKLTGNPNTADEVINIDSTLMPYLKNNKLQQSYSHTLKEVVIKDKRIVKTVSHKDYGSLSSLSSQPDHLINADMLKNCGANLLECLKTAAIGMTFVDNNFYVLRDYNQGKRVPVQVFFKGMPVDVNYLQNLTSVGVESIEIFLKDELGLVNSANNSNGAIVVNMAKVETTKITLAQLRDLIPPKNEVTFAPKGYAPKIAFYLPRYAGPRETQLNQTDTRSTIYWNPNITTDKAGNATMEYYNGDERGTYRAIIEGFDKDGNIGRQLFRYTVK